MMKYDRPPRSRDEITALPPIGTTECEDVLRESGVRLAPETLVFVIREALDAGATGLIELCGRLLTGAGVPTPPGTRATVAERIMLGVARKFGFDGNPAKLEEFWSACLDRMWDQVLAGRDEKPFWEANFAVAMHGNCLDRAGPLYRRSVREVPLDDNVTLLGKDDIASVMGRIDAVRILGRLPDAEAQAAYLTWVEERPIDSADSGSVKSIMGLSARHVHNLLRQARVRLSKDPVVQSIREAS